VPDREDETTRLLRRIESNTGYITPTDLGEVEGELGRIRDHLESIEGLLRDILHALRSED